jgi:hypothetical protein
VHFFEGNDDALRHMKEFADQEAKLAEGTGA